MSDIDSDDSDLRRAIALSLEEADSYSSRAKWKKDIELVNLISDDEEEDDNSDKARFQPARYGKVRSPGDIRDVDHQSKFKEAGAFTEPESPPDRVGNSPQHTFGLSSVLGLDRKKMEEERLNRAKKRKASWPSSSSPGQQAGPVQQPDALLIGNNKDYDQSATKKVVPYSRSQHASQSVNFSVLFLTP